MTTYTELPLSKQLITATETMKLLAVSRAKFYTKIVRDPDFQEIVKPLTLGHNTLKQYRHSDIIAYMDRKQQVA